MADEHPKFVDYNYILLGRPLTPEGRAACQRTLEHLKAELKKLPQMPQPVMTKEYKKDD